MGAGQNVSITLTIDEANALKAWTSQQTAVETLKKRLATLELKKDPMGPLKAGAMSALSTLGQCIAAITGIGSAIAGIMLLANQLKAEYANLKSRQAGAAGAQGEYAPELAAAIRSTGGKITGAEMEQLILKGSQKTGQSQTVVARNYNAAFTAKGPRNRQEALDRMEEADAAMEQYPEQDAQTLAQITAVTAQNKQAFGLSTQQALGYQQQAQNVSFVKDVAAFAANVGGKLSAIAKSGDANAAEAGALAGTLSQAGGDFEGSTSTMAALTLGAELKERLPKLKNFEERLKFMQSDPKNIQKYLEGGVFDGKKHNPAETGRSVYKAHIADLFNPQSALAKEFEANKKEYGTKEDWEANSEAVRQQVASAPSTQIAKAKRAGETTKQQLQLDDVSGAIAAEARTMLIENLKAAGETDIAQKIATIAFEWNASLGEKNPLEEVARQMGDKAAVYEQANVTEMHDDGFGNEFETVTRVKTPEEARVDKTKAKRLRDFQANLLGINKDLRAATVNKNAEAGLFDATAAVDAFAQDTTPTAEEAAIAKAKLKDAKEPVQAANRFENQQPGGRDRDKISRERLEKIEAEEARLDELVKTAGRNEQKNAAKRLGGPIADAEQAISTLEADETKTPEEVRQASRALDAARQVMANNATTPYTPGHNPSDNESTVAVKALIARLDAVVSALAENSRATDANRNTLEQNSAATEANTGAQGVANAPPRRGTNVTDLQNRKSP